MAQRGDILQTLELMRENLRQTLKETSSLRHVAVEEEVLEGKENIDKTCTNALRSLRQIETLVRYDFSTTNGSRGRNNTIEPKQPLPEARPEIEWCGSPRVSAQPGKG